VGVPVLYPTLDVGGLEARGELPWEMGGWAEVTLTLPERTEATMSAAQLDALATLGAIDEVPDPIPTTVTQDGEPYVKAIVGLDRSFGRVYLNAQWLHGFLTERRAADLRDYALVAARITLSDRWVLGVNGLTDGAGAMVGGQLSYLHGDAAELGLRGSWVPPVEGSALSGFAGASNVGTHVEVKF
jgi:hypothetical protein